MGGGGGGSNKKLSDGRSVESQFFESPRERKAGLTNWLV